MPVQRLRSAVRRSMSRFKLARRTLSHHRRVRGLGWLGSVRALWFILGRLDRLGRTILFYPDLPLPEYKISRACALLGYRRSNDPAAPFHGAVRWLDTTYPEELPLLDALHRIRPVANVGVGDISKARISALMMEVFGYCAEVDPTTHRGPAVCKANLNAMDAEEVVHCPIRTEDLRPGAIYQKVLGVELDGLVQEQRASFCNGSLVALVDRPRAVGRRFRAEGRRQRTLDPDVALTGDERDKVARLLHRMKVDLGDVDLMRDPADGRLFVIDVNPTAWGWSVEKGDSSDSCDTAVALGLAFEEAFVHAARLQAEVPTWKRVERGAADPAGVRTASSASRV